MSAPRLTGDELLALHDGSAARLLDLEERYNTQAALLDGQTELVALPEPRATGSTDQREGGL
jgi:hypothetical protein